MRRIIATGVLFALAMSVAAQTAPKSITQDQIQIAAKSVAQEFHQSTTSDPETKAVKRNTTWIIVLLAVIVVGAGVYLIADNANKHGSGGLSKRVETRPIQSSQAILRQQWQPRR